MLVAQRRMGKTSLMHELARRLTEAERFTCLFIDLQGATSAEDAVVKLSLAAWPYKNLREKTKGIFSNALAAEYGISLGKGVSAAIVEQLGCGIPHHVQMMFARIQETCGREHRQSVSAEEIEGIYKEGMLGTAGHAELTHYEERLQLVLGEPDFTMALEMLTEAAATRCLSKEALDLLRQEDAARLRVQGLARDLAAAQKNILWVLEHDVYLRKEGSGYVFISKLLRDWWDARHGAPFYTPVAQRASAKPA